MAARLAFILSTPLPTVLAWDWSEAVCWWHEADQIHAETYRAKAV